MKTVLMIGINYDEQCSWSRIVNWDEVTNPEEVLEKEIGLTADEVLVVDDNLHCRQVQHTLDDAVKVDFTAAHS